MTAHDDEMGSAGREGTSVQYDRDNNWVVVEMTGELNPKLSTQALLQAGEVCAQHHCQSILMDVRHVDRIAPFIDGYDFATEFKMRTGVGESLRCAFVFDPNVYPADRARTMETVARNRGNFSLANFSTLDAAVKYLREKPDR